MRGQLRIVGAALLGAALLFGCSDDEPGADSGAADAATVDARPDTGGIGNDVKPEKIAGGGTTGGAIDGRVNIYVVDGQTDKPLVGAFVMLGDGATDKGTTDSTGLISFRRPGLKGPIALTAGLTGYATSSLVGVNAANITLPLGSRTFTPPQTGLCSGTVKDWSSLPGLPTNHVRLGYAGYLLDEDLGTPRNEVPQPPGNLNVYAPGPPLNRSNWVLTVPSGDFGVFVLVYDLDTKGTSDSSDDTRALTHVGLVRGLKLGASQVLANVQIPIVAADATLKVVLPSLPSGTTEAGLGVVVQLATKELFPSFYSKPTGSDYPVPKLGGDFAGGNYWVIFGAQPSGTQTVGRKTESIMVKRTITDLGQTVQGSLLALPSDLKLEGRKLSFTSPGGVALCAARLLPETSGAALWSVSLVAPAGTSVSFTLPAIPSGAKVEPLTQGKLYLHASAADLPGVDLNKAKFKDLGGSLFRSAAQGATVELK